MGDLREPTSSSSSSPPSPPGPTWIGAERWAGAEKATQKIMCRVQPTDVSEGRRRGVIHYVQKLIRDCLGCEVFPYGSVPLKTYLPDGDIDLTAFGGKSTEDSLAQDIVTVLERESQNRAAGFVVKDVHLIRAEVKLVKCLVQNIVVDISFNQIGGLCTLCFLEQVDRLIGRDHLFKRSIILIKAWCYYESRILGALHGLISTYALETLVLYIFHVFHSTLNGPLAVLYKFLDYFSKFDWDSYCISLTGPIRISSLPEIVVETPEKNGDDLLLGSDFLRYCVDTFSVSSKGVEVNSRYFPPKHLNIVDPLKEHNNLGRSVNKGNFFRIRSAFTYGARKLGQILVQSENNIANELCNFFLNTLDRHGRGQRPDVQDPVPLLYDSGFRPTFSPLETEACQEEKVTSQLNSINCIGTAGDFKHNPDESPQNGVNNIAASGKEMKSRTTANGQKSEAMKVLSSVMFAEVDGSAKASSLLGKRFSGDAEDLATSRVRCLKISEDPPDLSPLNNGKSVSHQRVAPQAPHLYFSNSRWSNGKMRNKNSDKIHSENYEQGVCSGVSNDHGWDKNLATGYDALIDFESKDIQSVPNPVVLPEDSDLSGGDLASGNREGSSEYLNSTTDLTGDYNSQFNCLQYARWCSEPRPPPSHFQGMNMWETIQRPPQVKRNGFSNGVNGGIPRPVFYQMNPVLIPGLAFSWEEMPKPRGTGTYIPNPELSSQGHRPLTPKARSQVPARSPRHNGHATNFQEFHVDQGVATPRPDIYQSFPPLRKGYPNNLNGVVPHSEGVVEFGSVGHVAAGPPASHPQTSSQGIPASGIQRPIPVLGTDQHRFAESYHLKNEEDFPPLAS